MSTKGTAEKVFREQALDVFRRYLAERGLKWTKQRQAIAQAFLAAEHHVSAKELHRTVRNTLGGSIGLATVYRTLHLLCECNVARERDFGSGRVLFEHMLGHASHDHMICTTCGEIAEFEAPELQRLLADVAARASFDLASHQLVLFGTCRRCAQRFENHGRAKRK